MIILTENEASQISGFSEDGLSELRPRQLIGGQFVLPEAVLSDPSHRAHWDFLRTKPCREVAPEEFPLDSDE